MNNYLNDRFTKEELKTFYVMVKSLKCSIIYIKKDGIYGTDDNFIHLKHIDYPSDKNIIFYMKDFDTIKDIDSISEDVIHIVNYIPVCYDLYEAFRRLIDTVNFYNTMNTTFTVEDLKINDNFNEINSMKSTEGMGLLKLSEKYILTLFNGLLPVNKPDKIELMNKDIDQCRYLSIFNINKKKYMINVYLMYLFI